MPTDIIQGVQDATKTKTMELKTGDLGIDVSHANGVIDWPKVAADPQGIKFAILKASEGATSKDSRMQENCTGAQKAGLIVGFYHFATFNSKDVVKDAKQEAANFLAAVGVNIPDLPLVLDAETNKPLSLSKNEVLLFIDTFTNELYQAGYQAALYASPGFLQSYLPPNHRLGNIPVWAADYSGEINPVPGITKFWMRQYTDKGKVQGITGNVDMNRVL